MSLILSKLRIHLASVLSLLLLTVAHGQTVSIEDTFTRADGTDLGQTEIGGFNYFETGTAGQPETALLFGGELFVHGFEGVAGSAPGLAMIEKSLGDVDMQATVRFQNLVDPTAAGSRNAMGFMLRRNGSRPVVGDTGYLGSVGFNAFNEGQVEVLMGPGGGFLIREVQAGVLTTLVGPDSSANPFGGALNTLYSSPGQLPMAINGMPFDANGNGKLEDSEPFQLGVDLLGNSLQVLINGQTVHTVTLSHSAPINYRSYSGLYKNRLSNAAGFEAFNAGYDNLVMNGTNYDPGAPTPIVHVGDSSPLAQGWFRQAGAAGVANNGPVMDGGTPAWNINDSSTAAGSTSSWTRFVREDEVLRATTEGWTMKATVSVLNTNDVADGAIELSAAVASNNMYVLWLGSDANGNPTVSENQGTSPTFTIGRTATLTGAGYHDYEMKFDPTTQTVNVFADGNLVIDNLLPRVTGTTVTNRILWGSNASGGTGNANYSSVEFIVGTEPLGPAGDFNGDGLVDGADFLTWQRSFGSNVTPGSGADGSGDGVVDGADLDVWKQNFGSGGITSTVVTVPEPVAIVPVLAGVAPLLKLSRRRLR